MNKTLLPFLILIITGCSGSKIARLATQGELSAAVFNDNIPFYYFEKYTFIDVQINHKTYTFLFDTGWDITHIDKSLFEEIEFTPLQKHKTTGSSFEDVKLQYGTLSSLTIGQLAFKNIAVGVQDLSFIRSTFPDQRKIYGIIGTNILRKAFWQIDYAKQTIKFSNTLENFHVPDNAYQIPMTPKSAAGWGSNRIQLTINGVTDDFVFDTGSYGSFTANTSFLKRLEHGDTPLEEIKLTGQNHKRKFKLSTLKIDTLEFQDLEISIEEKVELLIGNDFLEDYRVTIDWETNQLYLQPLDDQETP